MLYVYPAVVCVMLRCYFRTCARRHNQQAARQTTDHSFRMFHMTCTVPMGQELKLFLLQEQTEQLPIPCLSYCTDPNSISQLLYVNSLYIEVNHFRVAPVSSCNYTFTGQYYGKLTRFWKDTLHSTKSGSFTDHRRKVESLLLQKTNNLHQSNILFASWNSISSNISILLLTHHCFLSTSSVHSPNHH